MSPGRMKVLGKVERKGKSGSALRGVNSQAEKKVCQGSVASDVSIPGIQQFKFLSFYVCNKKSKKMLFLKSQQQADMNKHKHTPTLQFHAP